MGPPGGTKAPVSGAFFLPVTWAYGPGDSLCLFCTTPELSTGKKKARQGLLRLKLGSVSYDTPQRRRWERSIALQPRIARFLSTGFPQEKSVVFMQQTWVPSVFGGRFAPCRQTPFQPCSGPPWWPL